MLVVLLILVLLGLTLTALFLLGFRLGGDAQVAELERVQAEARVAERRLHDLTKAAFVAMAEEADRRRRGEP